MTNSLLRVMERMNNCSCNLKHHSFGLKRVEIEHGAMNNISTFIQSESYSKVTVVCDENTYDAAGNQLFSMLTNATFETKLCIVKANDQGDVVAEEQSLLQVFLEAPIDTEIFVVVGTGTLHDIVRYVSYQRGKPFISVPTAASVDGFASAGCPLIIRGMKQTIQARAPFAIFCDLDVLTNAPYNMTAAGFGDILGKYTSLLDWKLSHLLADEPYCETGATITEETLEHCVANADEIATASSKGIRILMEGLIESGIVMMSLGHSRPASGGEHHLSHFWEMDLLNNGKRQILHGAKVGVATIYIAALYRKLVENKIEVFDLKDDRKREAIKHHWGEIQAIYNQLPSNERIIGLLQKVGAPVSSQELGIETDVVNRSLRNAYTLRERYTGLRMINENGMLEGISETNQHQI